ncbi:hypothetical protein ABKN59_003701 [Abortiporus biennis]
MSHPSMKIRKRSARNRSQSNRRGLGHSPSTRLYSLSLFTALILCSPSSTAAATSDPLRAMNPSLPTRNSWNPLIHPTTLRGASYGPNLRPRQTLGSTTSTDISISLPTTTTTITTTTTTTTTSESVTSDSSNTSSTDTSSSSESSQTTSSTDSSTSDTSTSSSSTSDTSTTSSTTSSDSSSSSESSTTSSSTDSSTSSSSSSTTSDSSTITSESSTLSTTDTISSTTSITSPISTSSTSSTSISSSSIVLSSSSSSLSSSSASSTSVSHSRSSDVPFAPISASSTLEETLSSSIFSKPSLSSITNLLDSNSKTTASSSSPTPPPSTSFSMTTVTSSLSTVTVLHTVDTLTETSSEAAIVSSALPLPQCSSSHPNMTSFAPTASSRASQNIVSSFPPSSSLPPTFTTTSVPLLTSLHHSLITPLQTVSPSTFSVLQSTNVDASSVMTFFPLPSQSVVASVIPPFSSSQSVASFTIVDATSIMTIASIDISLSLQSVAAPTLSSFASPDPSLTSFVNFPQSFVSSLHSPLSSLIPSSVTVLDPPSISSLPSLTTTSFSSTFSSLSLSSVSLSSDSGLSLSSTESSSVILSFTSSPSLISSATVSESLTLLSSSILASSLTVSPTPVPVSVSQIPSTSFFLSTLSLSSRPPILPVSNTWTFACPTLHVETTITLESSSRATAMSVVSSQSFVTTTMIVTSTWNNGKTSGITTYTTTEVSGTLIPNTGNSQGNVFAHNPGALAGFIIGIVAFVLLVAGCLLFLRYRHGRKLREAEVQALGTSTSGYGRGRPRSGRMLDEEDDLDDPFAAATVAAGHQQGMQERLRGAGVVSALVRPGRYGRLSSESDHDVPVAGHRRSYSGGVERRERDALMGDLPPMTTLDGLVVHPSSFSSPAIASGASASAFGVGTAAAAMIGAASSSSAVLENKPPFRALKKSQSSARDSTTGLDPAAWLGGRNLSYTGLPPGSGPGFVSITPSSSNPFDDPPSYPISPSLSSPGLSSPGLGTVGNSPAVGGVAKGTLSELDPILTAMVHSESTMQSSSSPAVESASGSVSRSGSRTSIYGAVGGGGGGGGYYGSRPSSSLALGHGSSSSGHGHGSSSHGHSSGGGGGNSSSSGHNHNAKSSRLSSLLPTMSQAPPTAYRRVVEAKKAKSREKEKSSDHGHVPERKSSILNVGKSLKMKLSGRRNSAVSLEESSRRQSVDVEHGARIPDGHHQQQRRLSSPPAFDTPSPTTRNFPFLASPPSVVVRAPSPSFSGDQQQQPSSPFSKFGSIPEGDVSPWSTHLQMDMTSPSLTDVSTHAPEGLLDPRLGLRLGQQGMSSSAAISFRDDVDYSRPIGGLVNNRAHSTSTFKTVESQDSERPYRRRSMDSKDSLQEIVLEAEEYT